MTMRSRKQMAGLMLVGALSSVGLLAARTDDPENVKRLKETRQCEGCSFQDANLPALNAELAVLRKADFRGAILYKANFRSADLTGASFGGADLSGADLRNAKGANLTGATTNAETTCPNGAAGPCAGW